MLWDASVVSQYLRAYSTPDEILAAIVDRLRERVAGYNDQNCWESDQPIPISHPGGGELCTVSMGGGDFPPEFFGGGGADTLTERGLIVVTPIVPVRGDRPYRRSRRVRSDPGSVLTRKRQILSALFADPTWEPAVDGRPLLRELMSPGRATDPHDVTTGESRMIAIQISMNVLFDWSLQP